MITILSTMSAFTLILMVSASAQEGLRRSDTWVNSSAATCINSSAAATICVLSVPMNPR